MIQLRHFLFPLAGVAAVSGVLAQGFPKSIGPQAFIPITNKVIAPDGYSRL